MTGECLQVIALVSGGKDSFFSMLHCLENGHRIVALANLHPPDASSTSGPQQQEETDLNSFMYQTVGHSVIPLYAAATGLPLFRQPIVGSAVQHGIDYRRRAAVDTAEAGVELLDTSVSTITDRTAAEEEEEKSDETESMVPLLRRVTKAHPEANALCTGAILSTYQRTRVESVALRLGLVPLSYLWQFPMLPLSTSAIEEEDEDDDAQLLRDMAAVGLDARIIKVASAGLDESFLWENVANSTTMHRIKRALRPFGGGGRGAVLGEGGEFETLVVNGPDVLFRRGRIVFSGQNNSRVVREGGGSCWLSVGRASVEMNKSDLGLRGNQAPGVRVPPLLDTRFEAVLEASRRWDDANHVLSEPRQLPCLKLTLPLQLQHSSHSQPQQWCFWGPTDGGDVDITVQTRRLMGDIEQRLLAQSLPATAITSAMVVLRHMSDFPAVNTIYGALFQEPNPPARVTIACGDCMLSRACGIAVYLTIQPYLLSLPKPSDDRGNRRKGLHVQSRSYWAPANIGPYSQAISVPLLVGSPMSGTEENTSNSTSTVDNDTPRAVAIAGQIPLVPATMALPIPEPPESDSTALQMVLALQHLWRVGVEMQVQWWTSAVAYFPRTLDASDMRRKSRLAAQAWSTAHVWSASSALDVDDDDDDDDDAGPDLWDRRYNSKYMTLVDNDQAALANRSLPDWDTIVVQEDQDATTTKIKDHNDYVPPLFAVEVDELPRASGVEWHAHTGLAKLSPTSVHHYHNNATVTLMNGTVVTMKLVHIVVVETAAAAAAVYVHTTASVALSSQGHDSDGSSSSSSETVKRNEPQQKQPFFGDIVKAVCCKVSDSMNKMMGMVKHVKNSDLLDSPSARPYLSYVGSESVSMSAADGGDDGVVINDPVIPCRSLWNSRGDRVLMVSLFQNYFTKNTSITTTAT